jgi:predicted negative regulator of RcsB-dependent stress response
VLIFGYSNYYTTKTKKKQEISARFQKIYKTMNFLLKL